MCAFFGFYVSVKAPIAQPEVCYDEGKILGAVNCGGGRQHLPLLFRVAASACPTPFSSVFICTIARQINQTYTRKNEGTVIS